MVSKGRSIVNQRVTNDPGTLKRVGGRDLMIYSDARKTKLSGADRVATQDSKTATKPLVAAARKSISITKGINRKDSNALKATVENSENTKGKQVSSVDLKARKVLADISNVQNNLSRVQTSGASKLVVSVGETITDANGLSKKSAKVCVENSEKFKSKQVRSVNVKVGEKELADGSNLKVYLSKTRVSEGAKLATSNNGKNERGPRVSVGQTTTTNANALSRKPVLDYMKCSDKGSGSSVKIKIRRKVAPVVSNAKGSLQKTRASDSFISLKGKTKRGSLINGVPTSQAVMDVNTLSRRSLKPIGNTSYTAFTGQVTLKSKCTSASKMSTSAAVTTLKKKGKIPRNVFPKNDASVSHESTLEKPSSNENDNYKIVSADIISKTKCIRRRSFTSSLMSRSELLGKSAKAIDQDVLPSIDDNRNPLEVTAYIDDIYQYYWVMEAQCPSMANYMASRTDITPKMRGVLINWLIEVHLKYELMQETLFLMVALFDRYLSEVKIDIKEIQLVGLTALLLGSKYEDFWHPRVRDLISLSSGSYSSDQMLAMEKRILEKLMFRLNIPTPYVFMLRFLKAAQSSTELEHLSFFLIELCLVEYEALNFRASLLSASAIYVARCTLCMTPAWTPLLCKHARYEESQLRACANMILKFQRLASKEPLTVTYEKYMHPNRGCVARITAMDRLPQ